MADLRGLPLEHGEVEVADRFLDQTAVVLVVEDLPGDLRRRLERQVRDLRADRLDRPAGLRLDLLPRLLDAPRPLGVQLLLETVTLRVGHLAGLGEDRLRLAASLRDERAVLLD